MAVDKESNTDKKKNIAIVQKRLKDVKRENVRLAKIREQRYNGGKKLQKIKKMKERRMKGETQKKKRTEKIYPESLVNMEQIQQAIKGVRVLSKAAAENSKALLDIGEDPIICLQVTTCQLPEEKLNAPKFKNIRIPLAHSIVEEETDVLLITRMLNSEHGSNYEKTLNHYKNLLMEKGAAGHITEIITLRQLRMEYKEFEAKRNLSNRFDVILAQDCVMMYLPKLLGKHFYGRKKIPIKVDLTTRDLEQHIRSTLSMSVLELSFRGKCSLCKVGRISQTNEQIGENLMQAVKAIAQSMPGGWDNVESLSLKTGKSKTVPFYVKFEASTIEFEKPEKDDTVIEGALDLLPYSKVVQVLPDGRIRVVRKKRSNETQKGEEKQAKKKARKLKEEDEGVVKEESEKEEKVVENEEEEEVEEDEGDDDEEEDEDGSD